MTKNKLSIQPVSPRSKLIELLELGNPIKYANRPGQYLQFLTIEDFNAAVEELKNSGFIEFEKGKKHGDFRIAGEPKTIEIQGRIALDDNQKIIIAPVYQSEEKKEEAPSSPKHVFFHTSPREKYSNIVDLLEQGIPKTFTERSGQYLKFLRQQEFEEVVHELKAAGFHEFQKGDSGGDFRVAGTERTIEIRGRIGIDDNERIIIAPSYWDSMTP